MNEFLSMGGYAAYVWPSYAIAAIVMVGLLVSSLRGLKSREAALRALEETRPRRRRREGRDERAGGAPRTAAEGTEG